MSALVNNEEVRIMESTISQLSPYFFLCGLADPTESLQALNIKHDYDGYDSALTAAHDDVQAAFTGLNDARDYVLADWEGDAATAFDAYAERVAGAAKDAATNIDAVRTVISEVLAEVKTIVTDVYTEVMDAAQIVSLLLFPVIPGPLASGIAERGGHGDKFPSIPDLIDPLALIAVAINDGLIRIVNIRTTVATSMVELGGLNGLQTRDGSQIADLDLNKATDWSIDPDHPDRATGFKDDDVNKEDQWVKKD